MNNYCIVSHKYKLIYIPIAKTGCTTLLNMIAELIHQSEIHKFRTNSHRDVHTKRKEIFNTSDSEICVDSSNAIQKYQNYFKFAFFRNPFTRIHSCYVDKLSLNTYGFDNNLIDRYKDMYRGMSFYDFLNIVKNLDNQEMDEHFRPQYTFLQIDSLDFVGKLENIHDDWRVIEKRLFLPHLTLPQYNKTQKMDYYTEESEHLVRQIYAKDFKLYGYSTTRIKANTAADQLPITITPDSLNQIQPFKDVFCEKHNDYYNITVTGYDPKIIIPYCSIRDGKGIFFQIDIFSPATANLTLYYTDKESLDIPEKKQFSAKLKKGDNTITFTLNDPDIVGRFRLKPSDTPGVFKIKKIYINEHTLPWIEDKDDLTEINKSLFSLPPYTQNNKNLFSMANYTSIYLPILEALQPKYICEIGSDTASNTILLAKFCQQRGSKLTIVDPIEPENSDVLSASHVTFHKKSSLEYFLQCNAAADVYFIDGDHNYQTVSDELESINRLFQKNKKTICLFIHDTSWPCAYRDLYYNPEQLKIHKDDYTYDRSLSLCSEFPVTDGLSSKYAVAKKEGGDKNGLKKAVDNFLKAYKNNWDHCSILSLYGLTILWSTETLTRNQKQIFDNTKSHFLYFRDFLAILEWNRLALLCKTQVMANTWKKNQEYIKQIQKENVQIRKTLSRESKVKIHIGNLFKKLFAFNKN